MYWRIPRFAPNCSIFQGHFYTKKSPKSDFQVPWRQHVAMIFLGAFGFLNLCRSFRVAHGWKPTSSDVGLRVRTAYLQPELCTCAAFFLHSRNRENVSKNFMCYKRCIFWCISSRLNSHNSDINRIRCIAVVRTAVFGRFAATRRVEATHTRNILSSASWCLPCGFEDSGVAPELPPISQPFLCVLLLRCLKHPPEQYACWVGSSLQVVVKM